MNKNLEELKKVKSFYCIEIKKNMIPLLEDFEERLKKVEAELGIYTEEEIKKIKVGGTDPN
jgi:hypothetical protein